MRLVLSTKNNLTYQSTKILQIDKFIVHSIAYNCKIIQPKVMGFRLILLMMKELIISKCEIITGTTCLVLQESLRL